MFCLVHDLKRLSQTRNFGMTLTEGLLHSKTSLMPNVATLPLVPLDSQMLPCWRHQSTWLLHEWIFVQMEDMNECILKKFRIIVESREDQKMGDINECIFFYLSFKRPPEKKVWVRNLPSGWSTEASDSPFQSCYSHHFWSLQTGTAMKIRGEKNQSGLKTVRTHSENLKLDMLSYTKSS